MDIQHEAIVKKIHGENNMLGGRTGSRAPILLFIFQID
jgi:hypothetical protein